LLAANLQTLDEPIEFDKMRLQRQSPCVSTFEELIINQTMKPSSIAIVVSTVFLVVAGWIVVGVAAWRWTHREPQMVVGIDPTPPPPESDEDLNRGPIRSPAPQQPKSNMQSASSRLVNINGTRISAQQIQALEQAYNTPVPSGDFWYDRISGAWGIIGGPTAGFMMPGLNLGGPLRSDASNGDTGVFINGRQLHRAEVVALLRIYPGLQRGRAWLDGAGNWGLEGGVALGNLWVAAQQAFGGGGAQREGILSGYDKTGIAVYGY
jgi:hypothetical protein